MFGGLEPLRRNKHGFTETFLTATRYKSRYKPDQGGTKDVGAWSVRSMERGSVERESSGVAWLVGNR